MPGVLNLRHARTDQCQLYAFLRGGGQPESPPPKLADVEFLMPRTVVFGDAKMTTALLGRLTHHCDIVETDNES